MEESQEERALALVKKAREALPPETMASIPGGTDAAVAYLVCALEALLSPHPIIHLDIRDASLFSSTDPDEYGPGQLEALQARIEAAGEKRFIISFPDVELVATDIWHECEGGPPDDPTAEDVVQVMRDYRHGSLNTIIGEWMLVEEIHVRRSDQDPDDAVAYDGA